MTATVRASLLQALPATLPNRDQTLLLRACLLEGEDSRVSWQEWRSGIADPVEALSARDRWARTLLPLLMTSLTRYEAEVDARTLSYLRAAFVKESLRFDVYKGICGRVLASLAEEGMRAILLKGAAFVTSYYDVPAHRHCHDIDLLVRAADAARIGSLVAKHGFAPARSPEGPAHALFTHTSGLPLRVHTRPFLSQAYESPVEELIARAEEASFDSSPATVLCPVDALVHLCGHVSSRPGVEKLRWISDACFLIRRTPQLDWSELVERAASMNVAVPLSAQLEYLSTELGVPIPASVLPLLRTKAAASSFGAIRAAFVGTLLEGWPGLKRCIRSAADWRAAALLATWAGLERGAFRWRTGLAGSK